MKLAFRINVTREPIQPAPPRFPSEGTTGAILDFWGIVREQEGTRRISALDYEAYERMAILEFERIAEKLQSTHPIQWAEVVHRIGPVPVGEPSIHLRVASKHRQEGFAFAKTLIEDMKESVPIWKKAIWSR